MSQRKNKQDEPHVKATDLPPLVKGRNIAPVDAAGPEFRSVAVARFQPPIKRFHDSPLKFGAESMPKESFDLKRTDKPPEFNPEFKREYNKPEFKPISVKKSWDNPQFRPIPNYYPLERSNRVLNLSDIEQSEVTSNLSEAFRVLGIQTRYFESPAGAALLTAELVEIHLYLWKTGKGRKMCIEVQRRSGDPVTFHRYARHILDAASGDFDASEYKDYSDSHYLKAAEKLLRNEMANAAEKREESLISIELAAGLLKKDRLDARILGMESLCILTDPRKTCLNTTLLASRAVILGNHSGEDHSAFTDIHTFVLNTVQKRCMSDESSLLEGMKVEYDSDEEDYFEDDDEERDDEKPSEYHDAMNMFVNYGLQILLNSWEVLTTFESFETEPEKTNSGQRNSTATLVKKFLEISLDYNNDADILVTLMAEVDRAESKAHNACLAGKCLKILCLSSNEALLRIKSMHGLEIATRAEEIGKVTNARLQNISGELRQVLEG